jgi:transcriptional accessory protein Tex/SPT6
LPIVLLTGEEWNPSEEVLRPSRLMKEDAEMRNIKSLMMRQVNGKHMVKLMQSLVRFLVYTMRRSSMMDLYLQYKSQRRIKKMLTRLNTNEKYMV